MLSRDYWLPVAKQLQAGYRVRIPCCKSDNSLLVSYDTKYWRCYCFRCGAKDAVKVGVRSIEQIKADKDSINRIKAQGVTLPSDYTQDIPPDARLWYLRYGISTDEVQTHGVGYSPWMRRIVLPVFGVGRSLDAVQLRAVYPDQKPKYLNPEGPRTAAAVFLSRTPDVGGPIIVTEDILSAIKIDRAGFCAASILGTNPTDARMNKLLSLSDTLIWWLDGDAVGRKGSAVGEALTELYGGTAKRIHTEVDPKKYSTEQIQDIIAQLE